MAKIRQPLATLRGRFDALTADSGRQMDASGRDGSDELKSRLNGSKAKTDSRDAIGEHSADIADAVRNDAARAPDRAGCRARFSLLAFGAALRR